MFFQACVDRKEENKYNANDCYNNTLSHYARNTAEALQTMMQVNNATAEEEAQQMANLTVQNQELHAQLDSAITQLTNLQNIL